jgi:hypothetical protein
MTDRRHEHLPGCPAAVSIPGAHEDCRCSELASLFRVPTPEECFGDPNHKRGRERWKAARREAAARYEQLVHELLADETAALARYRETAAETETLERDIATARRLLEDYRASKFRLG